MATLFIMSLRIARSRFRIATQPRSDSAMNCSAAPTLVCFGEGLSRHTLLAVTCGALNPLRRALNSLLRPGSVLVVQPVRVTAKLCTEEAISGEVGPKKKWQGRAAACTRRCATINYWRDLDSAKAYLAPMNCRR